MLDVKSVSKGFLAPRMTQAQRAAISSPATGLLVYQTNGTAGYYYYDGSAWQIIARGTGWTATGSDIYFNSGNVGIGNSSPAQALDVTGNVKFSGALMPGNQAGTATHLLTSGGAGVPPTWADPATYLPGYSWALDGNIVSGTKNFGTASNHDLPFITNNTEKMRLTAGGYLGLGISSPAAPFHLRASGTTTGVSSLAVFEETRDAGLGNAVVFQVGNRSASSNKTLFILGSTVSTKQWMLGTDALGNNSSNFYLYDANSTLVRMYIDGITGVTGLGTSAPQSLLHVKSTQLPGPTMSLGLFEADADPSNFVYMQIMNSSAANSKSGLLFGGSTTSNQWMVGNDLLGNNSQNFYIYDLGTFNTRFYIDQDGNTGLGGNIAPTEVLDVTGNAKFSGAITAGTWNGSLISPAYGGTGVNNGASTITLGGDFTLAGTGNLTLTTSATTNVTLPTSGTLVNTAVTSLGSLTSAAVLATVGTITSGTWNGTIISPTYGGTGVNNGSKTLTLGGNLTTSGASNLTLTTTGATNVTLPTSGTLVNTAVTSLGSLTSAASLATVGTITTGTWNATTIAANKGGTGLSSYTTGDMLYASGSSTIGTITGNTTTTKKYLSQTGTGSASAQPSWSQVHTDDISNIIKTSVTISSTTNVTTSAPLQIDVTVTGAQVNSSVIVNPRANLTSRLFISYCYVPSANTVRIVFCTTNGTIQLGSNKVFDVMVINP